MKLLSLSIIFIVIIFQIYQCQSLLTHSLKQSTPFSQVLQRAITLMGSDYSSKIDSELSYVRTLSQSQIIDYFNIPTYKGDVQLYWFRYYLLAQLSLYENRTWSRPLNEGTDPNDSNDSHYIDFKSKDDQYNVGLAKSRQDVENFLGSKLHEIEYGYDLLDKLQQHPFYQNVYINLPKGVVQHLHWSASFNYKAYFQVISDNLNAQPQNDDDRKIYLSTRISLEDITVGGVMNEKSYLKFFITKYSYLNPANLSANVAANQALIDSFKANYLNGTSCLNFQINKKGFLVDNIDMYLRGFIYSQVCSDVVIYDDKLANDYPGGYAKLNQLLDDLKEQDKCFETDQNAINELPKSNLLDNNEPPHILQILGIWYKFELIFSGQSEIIADTQNFIKLSDYVFQKLSEQKVIGVEFRNKNDSFQIQAFQNSSITYNLPFDYILPGRKISGTGNKGGSITSAAEKNADSKFAGIDFFGFEDDPYNGARNFFPLRLTQILPGDTVSYFDKMFKYLDTENGSMILHSGETAFLPSEPITTDYADKNYINDNLIHAALLPGIKRIGHGFEVSANILLINIIEARGISLEVCPLSNQILNFHDVNTNPFVSLLRSGIHMSINPDDPGIFGYDGVANDWFWILMETDLKASEIYLLLKYSIEHSYVPQVIANKETLINQVAQDLHNFFNGLQSPANPQSTHLQGQTNCKSGKKNFRKI